MIPFTLVVFVTLKKSGFRTVRIRNVVRRKWSVVCYRLQNPIFVFASFLVRQYPPWLVFPVFHSIFSHAILFGYGCLPLPVLIPANSATRTFRLAPTATNRVSCSNDFDGYKFGLGQPTHTSHRGRCALHFPVLIALNPWTRCAQNISVLGQ